MEYTTSQAAEILGCDISTVQRKRRIHNLGRTIGKRLKLLSEADIEFMRNLPGPGNPDIANLRQKTLKSKTSV